MSTSLLFFGAFALCLGTGRPIGLILQLRKKRNEPKTSETKRKAQVWWLIGLSLVLVILGAFIFIFLENEVAVRILIVSVGAVGSIYQAVYQTLYFTTRRSWLVAAIIICSVTELIFALTLLATDQQTRHTHKLIVETLLYILPLVFVLQYACMGLTYVDIFETRTLKSIVNSLLILNIALCFNNILAALISLGLYVGIIVDFTLYLLIPTLAILMQMLCQLLFEMLYSLGTAAASTQPAKEAQESRHRNAENQLHAGNSYTIPDSDDLGLERQLSGLPWGGFNMHYIVNRGKATKGDSNIARLREYQLEEMNKILMFPYINAIIKDLKSVVDVIPNLVWYENDPPSSNILKARLRAKKYGAEVITTRHFLRMVLNSRYDGNGNMEISAPIMELAQKCIRAMFNSAQAFWGMGKRRLVVTNVWVTSHAQWGHVVVLHAAYKDPRLRPYVSTRALFELTVKVRQFLVSVAHPSSALADDIRMLQRCREGNHAGGRVEGRGAVLRRMALLWGLWRGIKVPEHGTHP